MTKYISKSAIVAEIEKLRDNCLFDICAYNMCGDILSFLDTLEVREFQKKKLYIVTRCEEHSDYVEKAFFSEKKAEEYCKQFEGNEDAYGRDITEIEVDCPLEVKEVDLEYNGKAMLHVLEKGVKQGKRELIDKACKWLRENWRKHVWLDGDNIIHFGLWENDFRKAMDNETE